jgi:RNA polymerase sigma-70 factor (ECF subfamily)
VLAVVYLIFNEGYGGRFDLAAEAIRLGRALAELMPDEAEVHGLLALMLFAHARRETRFGPDGAVVLLADQDRSLWDAEELAAAHAALERACGRGPYALQASLAELHAAEPPDWPRIAALYGELGKVTGSPVVQLNRAVAVAESGAVDEALAQVDSLARELDGYHYLHATRAELLRRLGRFEESRGAYSRALELVHSDAERLFLQRRLEEVS